MKLQIILKFQKLEHWDNIDKENDYESNREFALIKPIRSYATGDLDHMQQD